MQTQRDGDADHGIAARGMPDLAIAELGCRIRARQIDRYQHFSRFERGGHDVDEEILRGNAPAALRARQLQFALQRDNDRGPVGGRIGIGQQAADRAARTCGSAIWPAA